MDHILSKGYKATSGQVVTRGFACALSADDTVVTVSGAGAVVLGVYQETLDPVKVTTGKAVVGVALLGITRVKLGTGGATRWAKLKTDATGQAVVSAQTAGGTAPTPVFAIAMTAGNAGDEIDALLTPGAYF
jgi:hypothetical protein